MNVIIFRRLFNFAFCLCLFGGISVARSYASCTIQITSAYTCDSNGNAYTPEVGDAYYVRFNYTVTGTPAAAYNIQFNEANQVGTISNISPSAGSYWFYYGFDLPLDSSVPVTIKIDPQNVTGAPASGRTYSFSFTPQPPSTPIFYFDTLTWTGTETFTVDWTDDSSVVLNGFTWLGEPTTDSFVQLLSETLPPNSSIVNTTANGEPVMQTNYNNYTPIPGNDSWVSTNTYNLALSSVRANPTLLRQATWPSIAQLPASFQPWLGPDSQVQSTDPSITAFVATVLPSNYLTTMTPYDAARALFLAVVARTTYAFTPNNDGTAVATLEAQQADCYGFSTLFNACARAIGIPSRTICGYWNGPDTWHCIAEFYLPGAGWIEADGSSCELLDPTGTYSYYFGSDPELNSLCICSRGTNYVDGSYSVGAMQVGAFWYTGNDSWGPYGNVCSLTPVALPASFSLYATPPALTAKQGAQTSSTITVNPANGFSGTVSFSAAGLPAGVTAAFSPTTVAGGGSTTVTFTISPTAAIGSSSVTITGTSGSLSSTVILPLTTSSSLAITSFSPPSGPVGTVITVNGTGFTGATAASVDGIPAPFTIVSDSLVDVTVPSGAATGAIHVRTPAGLAVSPSNFTVTAPTVPTIASFTPTSGPPGTVIVVTGTNFTGTTAVSIDGVNGPFTVVSSTTEDITVPSAASTGPIHIKTPAGLAVSSISFTVIPGPTITSFTPSSGPVGTVIAVTGTGFTGTTAASVDSIPAAFTVISNTLEDVTVPSGAATGAVHIKTPAGLAVSPTTFTVTAGNPPTITSFTPSAGPVGTVIVVTGTNFTGTTAASVDSVPASFTVVSSTVEDVTVPSGAATGAIHIRTASGLGVSASNFTVN